MENDKTCPEHVTVDLTGVGGWEDFWGRIQTAFVFSDGFGKNWDAFWDVLSKECPASKERWSERIGFRRPGKTQPESRSLK